MALDSSCFQRLLLALAVTFRGAERLTWGWGRSGLGKGPSVHRGQWLKALSWGGGMECLGGDPGRLEMGREGPRSQSGDWAETGYPNSKSRGSALSRTEGSRA